MAIMSGRQAIMEIFQAEGVQYIFGNPGTTELGFVDILQDYPQLQYTMCLHEGAGHGRCPHVTPMPLAKRAWSICTVAPGLGNALGMLYNATSGQDAVGSDGWPAG